MNQKTKNILLVAAFLMIVMVCYHLAFSVTLTKRAYYNSLRKEKALFEQAPRQRIALNRENEYYDSILNANHLTGASLQANLLKVLDSYTGAHDLKITEFNEPHLVEEGDRNIKSYIFGVQGSFQDILGLMYQLEQGGNFGQWAHIHLEKKKDVKTGSARLQALMILQRLE